MSHANSKQHNKRLMKILIINSKGHWINGWMTSPDSLHAVVDVLQKASCQVKVIEIATLTELEQILSRTSSDTLVWANAYWVGGADGTLYNLPEQISKHNLPMLGSVTSTLTKLLDKGVCQQLLKEAKVPTPHFIIISNEDAIEEVPYSIQHASLSFPLVIKPTNESRSQGVTKVDNKNQAVSTIAFLRQKFPESNIIIEEFLPNNDVTCGFMQLGNKMMLLPSFNVVKGMDCSTEVLSEAHYQLPPSYEEQVLISDTKILEQLQEHLPRIIESLHIQGVTRVDARLDKNGTLNFFDINGMPGLNYPISALIKQCFVHFPAYSKEYLFQCLIHTIVLENFQRYHLPSPATMQEHHLFKLESETVISREASYY